MMSKQRVAVLESDFILPRTGRNPPAHPEGTSDLSDNGVAAGDVTDNSAVLWARSLTSGTIRFEVSTDPDFHEVIRHSNVTVAAGGTAHAQFENLRDGVQYYYRAVAENGDVESGEFTTAFRDGFHGLTFGVSGDWRGGNTPYAAISNADDADLDFFVQLGDTIYGDRASETLPFREARTLEEFHLRYIETLTERGDANFLVDVRESAATWAMIDDHEVIDDFAGGAPAGSDPRFDSAGADYINETEFYGNGLQAFQDYQPIEQRVWSGTGDDRFDGAPDLYRTQAYGDDAAIFLVDARSFRDDELANADLGSPSDVGRFLTQSFDTSRTMLGDAQLDRLLADLLAAENAGVVWKFVMLPEPIQNLGPAEAADRYEGYAAERTALLRFIDENDIQNVVFVSADIHGTVVNNLTYQLQPGGPQVALDSWEITTGSVAFGTPFGASVWELAVNAGLVPPALQAAYAAAPVVPDLDNLLNDKDDILEAVINGFIGQFGYDPLGLDRTLPQATGLVDATLLSGDYVAAHSYGWTQFVIDPITHELLVTTYGIAPYRESDPSFDPAAVAALVPQIVQQFRVSPDLTLVGSSAADTLAGGNGDDIIDGGRGDDVLTGNLGSDHFSFRPDSGQVTITDFDVAQGDRLVLTGFGDIDTPSEAMGFATQVGQDVLMDFGRTEVLLLGTTLAEVQNGFLFG
jgi:phosphodiesterase/alkaline phosphatase D-like protein